MLECVVKPQTVRNIALGVTVVLLGALGVAGGKRTVQGIKSWVQSIIKR